MCFLIHIDDSDVNATLYSKMTDNVNLRLIKSKKSKKYLMHRIAIEWSILASALYMCNSLAYFSSSNKHILTLTLLSYINYPL